MHATFFYTLMPSFFMYSPNDTIEYVIKFRLLQPAQIRLSGLIKFSINTETAQSLDFVAIPSK